METLDACIAPLSGRHRLALQWFIEHAHQDHGWPKPVATDDGETLLASKAKGIYKPGWSKYALSVRQSLGGQYPDREPVIRPDGTWSFSYFQENEDPLARDDEFTNRGLIECWRDKVPLGVFRQTSGRPNARYHILGVALVSGWDAGYFFLEGFALAGVSRGKGPTAEMEQLARQQEQAALVAGVFDPSGTIDARERAVAQIVRRRGQPAFRTAVLSAYGGQCAISGCDAAEALEAGHISPYRGPDTNHVTNGILLRADLHTLFDLGLIAIAVTTMTVLVAPAIAATAYSALANAPLRLPSDPRLRPSIPALDAHRAWTGL
jgi:putative restriction endonuclease